MQSNMLLFFWCVPFVLDKSLNIQFSALSSKWAIEVPITKIYVRNDFTIVYGHDQLIWLLNGINGRAIVNERVYKRKRLLEYAARTGQKNRSRNSTQSSPANHSDEFGLNKSLVCAENVRLYESRRPNICDEEHTVSQNLNTIFAAQ